MDSSALVLIIFVPCPGPVLLAHHATPPPTPPTTIQPRQPQFLAMLPSHAPNYFQTPAATLSPSHRCITQCTALNRQHKPRSLIIKMDSFLSLFFLFFFSFFFSNGSANHRGSQHFAT